MTDFDINVKKIQYDKNKFGDTCMTLIFYGKDINNFVINSLRKACTDQVPIYAFDEKGINIMRNSSVYDQTELKMILSCLPIPNVNHNIKFLPLKYYQDSEEFYMNDTRIEYYIKKINEEYGVIKNVTTNDIKISINDKIIENNKLYSEDFPFFICNLRYKDEIELSMKAKLGVGEINSIYNASHCWFYDLSKQPEEIPTVNKLVDVYNKEKVSSQKIKIDNKTTNYIFKIESSNQLEELEIIKRGINLIILKTNSIKNDLENSKIKLSSDNKTCLDFENEDFTCIGQINYLLQSDPNVIYSGASKPNLLEKRINLKVTVKKEANLYDVIIKNIDKSLNYYTQLQNIINEII